MLKALLFDLDGTLTNTDPVHFRTWKELLRQYGLEIDQSFYRANFSGRMNEAIVRDLLPQLSAEDGKALSWHKEAEFRDRAAGELQPLAGLLDLLDWADAQQLKQAVVTNAPVENADFMLQVLGLRDRLTTVILGEALERGKPDPLPYQVALEKLDVAPTAALAFEDSPTGIRSAVGAGILTVAIASTHTPEELYAIGATLVATDFADPCLTEFLTFSFPHLAASRIETI